MGERLDGTVALVTGASSGIGEATARALARAGARVPSRRAAGTGSTRWRPRSATSSSIEYIVTRPWRVAVNEIMVRPTEEEW